MGSQSLCNRVCCFATTVVDCRVGWPRHHSFTRGHSSHHPVKIWLDWFHHLIWDWTDRGKYSYIILLLLGDAVIDLNYVFVRAGREWLLSCPVICLERRFLSWGSRASCWTEMMAEMFCLVCSFLFFSTYKTRLLFHLSMLLDTVEEVLNGSWVKKRWECGLVRLRRRYTAWQRSGTLCGAERSSFSASFFLVLSADLIKRLVIMTEVLCVSVIVCALHWSFLPALFPVSLICFCWQGGRNGMLASRTLYWCRFPLLILCPLWIPVMS
jgi:hypothetical protein